MVLAGILALEIAYGAPLGHALLYLAYEAAYVVLPGCVVHRALSNRPCGALRRLAMGWALGYVLEILAFMLTAATGTRPAFAAYPLVVLVAAVVATRAWRRGVRTARTEEAAPPDRFGWLVAAVCLAAVGYIGLACFPGSPLPGAASVTYFIDDPRWISLAAEAKHHWPITEPSVSGQPLPYHYFVNIHMAAASQVTGLGLPLVYLRLYLLPMIVLLVLELVVAGRSFVRSARVGLAAAGLAVFVGQLRLDSRHTVIADTPFLGPLLTYLFRSPSFVFGLIVFVPLMTVLGERIATRERVRVGDWALIALLMIGASDAKVVILPLVLVALVLYAAVGWLLDRRIRFAALLAGGLASLVMGAVYVMQYRGHPSELGVHPFAIFGVMPAVALLKAYASGGLPSFPGKHLLVSAGGAVFGLVGFLGPQLAGLAWIVRRRFSKLGLEQLWLLALLGAGLALGLTLGEPGTANQLYFVGYGVAAGCVLSAEGLRIAWTSLAAGTLGPRRGAAAVGIWVVALAGVMLAPLHVFAFSGPQKEPHLYLFWYAGLVIALAVLLIAARRWFGATRRAAALLGCGALVAVGVLDAPGIYLRPALAGTGTSAVNKHFEPMSGELYRSLAWIRDHTPPGAVLAVNNQWLGPGRTKPFEFDYSAFSERRVFLEGWAYSQGVRDRGFLTVNSNPFPERLRLNRTAFLGDGRALAVMKREYGVRYLLVDPSGGDRADVLALERVARLVRATPVPVFALR
jgi:hypothetical protein